MRRIDAHQHYWTVGAPWHVWPTSALPQIFCDFTPADLDPARTLCEVSGTILVQSQPSHAETAWMLSLAARTPSVLGVVGWIDVDGPDPPERICELARHPLLKGLRPMLQDLPADWILRDAAVPALRAMVEHKLVFDALVRPVHLPAIATLAERYPTLAIVIDHAAKPDIAGRSDQPWHDDLARIARCPNVACKLSGLITEAADDWAIDDLTPWADHILSGFGSERVIWGSDWPVLLLRASYAEWLAAAGALVQRADHAAVFAENAARIYDLDPAPAIEAPRGRPSA
jgi:L-fuconolactonase